MSRTVDLPVGEHPGWELHDRSLNVDGCGLLPVSESLVLLQSLKQSRERWLSCAFPRLPKGRGSKQVAQNVPLHEYKAHDKFELSVGPSIFPETALFEAVYTTDAHSSPSRPSGFASPELINMVSAAEASNPELKLLLDQIRTKPAYEADYKRLGELLQSMFPDHFGPNATAQTSAARSHKWDLVIELREKPTDRWIFPRGVVQLGKAYDTGKGKRFDVMISTMLPYTQEQIGLDLKTLDQQNLANAFTDSDGKPNPVSFHWKGVTQHICDLLTQWSLQPENWEHFKFSNRIFLPHRLPEGELLEIIRAALAPTWTMKSIKPVNADSGRTKRKSSRRKPAQGKVAPAPTALDPAPFAWPSVPPPLNIVQVQPGLPDQQAAPPPSEHGHPSPHAPAYPQASQPVEQMPSSPSSSRRSIKVEHPRPTREFSSHSPQPTQPSIHPPEFQIPVVEQPPPRASTSASAPPRAPEASEVPTASASDSNASNASSPVGSPSPSMDGSEPPNKRRRVQPKPRFSHPLPACKTCQRTNVQLLHGGQFCRMCIDVHRPQPPPPPPPRPQYHHSASYYQHYHHASAEPPITFSYWAPPPPPPPP